MLKAKPFFSALFILSFLLCDKIHAQNIVRNGSFETDSVCPNDYGLINYASGWITPTSATPDYYDTCSHFRVTVPSNDFGTQVPHSGNAYAGMGFYLISASNYCEYIQNHLSHPLVKGNTYYLSMYVSLAECSGNATNKIGAYFSTFPISSGNNEFLSNYSPQIVSSSFITSKTTWTKIEGTFVAIGGEEYITIGKFDSTSASTTSVTGTWYLSHFPNGGYYYIDDVNLVDTCLISSQNTILRNDTNVCSNQISLTLNTNTPFNSGNYLWSTNDTTSSIDITHAGTYWVKISHGSCLITDTVNINDRSVNVSLGNDTTICSNNHLVLVPQHSALVYFLWQNNSTSSYFTATTSGIYWVKVFNSSCSSTDSININYVVPPKILGNNFSLCNNSIFPLTLSATRANADSYLWNNNSTDSFMIVNDSGLYWVRMSKNSCIVSDSLRISKNLLLKPNLGPDTTMCNGTMLTLNTHQVADYYTWYSLNTFIGASTSSTFNVNSSGTYIVEANKGSACKDRDTIVVNYNAKPTVNLGKDTLLCYNSTFQLHPNVNMTGLTFKWQNGDTSSHFTVTNAGNYWIEANNGGCRNYDTINISFENQITDNLGNDTSLCQGQTFHLTANITGATSWRWNTNAFSNFINITSSGIYWNEASKGNCKVRDSVNVSFLPKPSVNLGNDTLICANTTLNLKVDSINAAFLWSNGSTANNINVNSSGHYWIKATQNSCSSYDTIFVNTITPPTTHIGNDTNLCGGTPITLNAYTFGATYLWQNESTASTFTVNNQGKYWVKITKGICQIKDSLFVSYTEKPKLDLGNDTSYCFNNPIVLDASSTNADSYFWQNGSTSEKFVATTAGLFWVAVKKSVCVVSDSIFLSQKPIPIINFGINKKICKEDMLTLDAGNVGSIYLWNNQSTNETIKVKAPGKFSVKVINSQGCFRIDSITLDTFISPIIFLGNDNFFCEGKSITLDAGNQFKNYLWQDGSTHQAFTATTAGNYFVKVIDQNNCSASDSIYLSVKPKPYVHLINELKVCEPDTFVKAEGNFVSCLWQDGSVSPSLHITDYGNYSVTVTDANKCTNTSKIDVVSNCSGNVFVPNAFTPNADGNNEIFYPVTRNVKSISFKIFNRWGEIVFESNDFKSGWDGTFKNEKVQSDVYFYVVNYIALDENSYTKSGNVTLLR